MATTSAGRGRRAPGITVSRLTARSVVLSVLLGAHPAWASASELVRLTADFGIKEPTLRVALTRMVGAGDLVRSADGYRLSERLLARQRRQDDALDPRLRRWDGTWTTLVITSVGTDARTRALLRTTLHDKRFAELREGVWMRPANLELELTDFLRERVRVLQARDDDPAGLTARLWDLAAWVDAGCRLLADMSAARDVPRRFAAAAGMVRHLLTDPVLPDELLPDGWPGAQLRSAYQDFATELAARRDDTELMEAT
jgi:phenylacetic acid degradation operon negative regulatory protein